MYLTPLKIERTGAALSFQTSRNLYGITYTDGKRTDIMSVTFVLEIKYLSRSGIPGYVELVERRNNILIPLYGDYPIKTSFLIHSSDVRFGLFHIYIIDPSGSQQNFYSSASGRLFLPVRSRSVYLLQIDTSTLTSRALNYTGLDVPFNNGRARWLVQSSKLARP